MKRTAFKKKSYDDLIKSSILKKKEQIRKSINNAPKSSKKMRILSHNVYKKVKVHWKPPAWFMSIPTGSHGSNPVQKRLWKLTSDFVRIYDFEQYGVCASCNNIILNWEDGDCGHYKAWAVCNNYFKFNRINLSYQCKNCNRLSDGNVGHTFGETLKKRHGENHLKNIEDNNSKLHGGKLDNIKLVEIARHLIDIFKTETILKPDYYEKVIRKIEEEQTSL